MEDTIVVLTEVPLGRADADNLLALADSDDVVFLVVVPEDRNTNVLAEFLHHLSLLELAEAFRGLSHGRLSSEESKLSAEQAVRDSVAVLESAGLRSEGITAAGNPVDAMVRTVAERSARQAVVVTRPHAVADTLHRDWASRTQEKVGVPVLHLYAGSGFIGDS